jgi:hypothetical protein
MGHCQALGSRNGLPSPLRSISGLTYEEVSLQLSGSRVRATFERTCMFHILVDNERSPFEIASREKLGLTQPPGPRDKRKETFEDSSRPK